ncbi:diguanylate cyclase [Pseudomonas fluorescens]|uniref:diguanylate cyclase n=1 Tax=Pseudomonas fluorescens TaxID=294 RepID=A0A944HGL4_PSEFL|nr:diguanylate cyclase [Pseudomonas fluorescens]MBT2297509.1 GGDEF domain-containing protein [Pseudomonas fluorescens]MBT2305707.1 GGDEF domain-containing protein [Pseudomonas fluorescens]MBT2314270.1 GGDEF domain-containing protein [Pseudomonas fluorescens]MBT2319238.1 GGDEF domain-containing protein [Pseudomonas fluorescens]MBT2327448.1 GGDEF domain-containing protein [Pseudomonas fluorescens]
MSVTAAVGPVTLFWTNETRLERNVVESQIESIRNVQSLLVDAETGERGYALTGKDVFLQPYYIAVSQLPGALESLRRFYQEDPAEEVARVEDLIAHAELKMEHLDRVVKLTSLQGNAVAEAEIAAGGGIDLMDAVRTMSAKLIADETEELVALEHQLLGNIRWAVAISIVSFIITLMLGRFIYTSMRSSVRRQSESAAAAILASDQLSQSLVRLKRRNGEIGLLAEMARLVQTELSQKEILQLASTYCQRLIPASEGEFFLYRNSADVLQHAASWGRTAEGDVDAILNPKDCWAIRRGRWHLAEHHHDLCCPHYPSASGSDQVTDCCLPLMAYGEILGLLHIRQTGLKDLSEEGLQIAEAVAEQTALALANGRMRQVLETQSIKDPLTELYNRRFMDETLKRELSRSERNGSCLSVVMLDLDNFKHLNDAYGHSAGDAVLRAVSALILQSLRSSDIACRFGGEELIVILPDCPSEGATSRAEAIRASLEGMSLKDHGQTFTVTASFGVASTETSGTDQNALLKNADSALYAAKRSGKNRVECWPVLEIGTA